MHGDPVSRAVSDDASHVLGELAIAAAGIGTFDWDLDAGVLTWDDQLITMFGFDRDTFDRTIDGFNAAVHPHDLPRVTHALRTSIATCGDYEAEYRIVLPNGATRWIAARGRALPGDDGRAHRVLGAAYDTTAGRESGTRVGRVLEAMPTAFYSTDREWRFTYVNAEAERLLGRTRDELLGRIQWELFPAAVDSDFETHYRAAMATGRPVTFEAYYPEPLDQWYELRAWPGPDGLSVYFVEITERRRAQEDAERSAERAALMARVTTELTETLQGGEAVTRLAQLLVPTLADWCIVTLVDDDEQAGTRRGLRDVAWWHADPARRDLLERYATHRLESLHERSLLSRALETGQTVAAESDATPQAAAMLDPGPARDALLELAPETLHVLRCAAVVVRSAWSPWAGTPGAGTWRARTSAPPRRSPDEQASRWTTHASTASSGGWPRASNGPCSPPRPSRTTCRSRCATSRPRRRPRWAGTGTTRSCSGTARRCW
ncbi:PAS domain-containing protein [Cellulomonas sp. ATA003]|uniref:PAS domain-containing protein n=1 Tax=Cellulomonas sp. ATA003 TaxID=3073064 RepID=UPI0028730F12|nr:PAS domain-containing protein [Cellulomonas sp. ATA003]WNB85371.1 PAS domain-containing protein [Cellulomonas sp. ATA003]